MRTDSESGYESQDSREPSNSHGRCGKSKSKGEKKYVTKAKKTEQETSETLIPTKGNRTGRARIT